jgi:hypothetical protein
MQTFGLFRIFNTLCCVPVFNLQLCGVSVFSNRSGMWPAIVDTGAACLSLPNEFFKVVSSSCVLFFCDTYFGIPF